MFYELDNRVFRRRDVLLDRNQTGFLFVLNPERLPILETKKAVDLLDQYDLVVSTLIINKVLPEEADGDFIMERKKHEKQYIELIKETFTKQQLIFVPLFSQDIISEKQLVLFSEYFGKG